MSSFDFEVGDSFEGGPIELQRYIGQILGAGGKFALKGEVVTITYLPPKKEKKVEPVVVPEPEVAIAPEPKAEDLVEAVEVVATETDLAEHLEDDKVLEIVEEAKVEEAPVKRGRPRSFKTEE